MAWVIELKRLEDETSTMEKRQWKTPSIYKVPPRMTVLNKIAYQPQLVSFGPYHHGEEHLLPMEEHKHRTFVHFLKRTKMPLQIIADNLTNVVQELKDSYDSLGDVWQLGSGRFLRLMVLDGCFMLEVLCYYYAKMSDSGNYTPTDPIFSTHGMLHVMHHIRRDMLLLENQLPLLVLIELAAGICPEDRVLRLPFLLVDDTTESMFLNLIAFERLHVGTGNENASGSEEAVVLLFNLLARDIMYNPQSSMASVLHDITVYRRSHGLNIVRSSPMPTT
ncbi:hypothetical protein Acr_28g0012390 [Actinidia rufa]|uniref:Uncharacterized protein n=1 Tax=Actinidia rufa TaxID=165716 RepID=A0A7J0HCU0_9ERIC|nr:hypothetical protein Acr_28g0012390 [Actinidia rufa]